MELIPSIVTLSITGIIAALVLYLISRKFSVIENPKIDKVQAVLPGVDCGGCGYPGCRIFAEECVKASDLEELFCPVGGNSCMADVADIMGFELVPQDPQVAVLKCYGTNDNCPKENIFDGTPDCSIANALYGGETACQFGCLQLGECVDACEFGAMYMDKDTNLPAIIDDKCTACNACVKACPRDILELRRKNKKDRKIFVACVNTEKEDIASEVCKVACTGCGECFKVCKFDAIRIDNNLAYIDPVKCKLCRKCAPVCPSNSIHEINFPPKKEKVNKEKETTLVSEGNEK